MSPFTIQVLHHGGDCKDGGLRWLRNVGTCLSGYATSYIRKRYLIILGQCIGKFLWESGRRESGRICACHQSVENVSMDTVFGSHIFSRAVAANCPCLVKFVCVCVCVCVEHVYQESVASTTATRCLLVCCWYSTFCILQFR